MRRSTYPEVGYPDLFDKRACTALAAGTAVPADKCDAAREMAAPGGDTISEGANVPVVLNFEMVDSDNDGAISKDEFSKACSDGMVKADEATVKDME